MSYTALYRRYRPDTFSALVGQPHIARILASAVRRGNFVHAYLFCGPRGTGKTSAARILARAIICQQPTPEGNPCGCCPACQRALAGESLDIIEIDGASNRGIDEVRDLRERVKYAPAQESRKIYIIDEVHMLTFEAFNAILKVLEEPPQHVVFIFATTAPHKLPPTVLSRCQRFDFRRIGENEIAEHLLHIAEQEGIELLPEAARLIAKKADGGMRDAVSLLDQCAAAIGGPVGSDTVCNLLGIVDQEFIHRLAEHLLAHDLAAALTEVEQLVASGKDLRQAVADLCETLRDGLLQVLADPSGSPYPPAVWLDLLTGLADLDAKLRQAAAPRISLELALIKACAPQEAILPAAKPLAEPQRKRPAAPLIAEEIPPDAAFDQPDLAFSPPQDKEEPAAPPAAKKKSRVQPAVKDRAPQHGKPQAATAAGEETGPPNSPPQPDHQAAQAEKTRGDLAASEKSGADPVKLWPQILSQTEQINRGAFFRLENCRLSRSGNQLVLEFAADREGDYRYFNHDALMRQVMRQAMQAICGDSYAYAVKLGDFMAPDLTEEEEGAVTEEAAPSPGPAGETETKQQSLF